MIGYEFMARAIRSISLGERVLNYQNKRLLNKKDSNNFKLKNKIRATKP